MRSALDLRRTAGSAYIDQGDELDHSPLSS